MTVLRILDRLVDLGGAARRSELGETIAVRHALADAVAAGAVRDLGGGWVARADADRGIVLARRLGASLTCTSAARHHGIATLRTHEEVHLAVPRSRGDRRRPSRPSAGVVVHRESVWTRPAVATCPVAPADEVVLRALRCLEEHEAIVIADSALHQGLVTAEELERQLRGPGSPSALARLARCDRRSRSASETLARLALRAAGLPAEAGVVISGVGEVDLLVGERVVVECDGFAYHSGRREFRNYWRRDRELVARGYVVLRFTWEDVVGHPEQVVDAVRRVLARLR